jgi:hypothetical protein
VRENASEYDNLIQSMVSSCHDIHCFRDIRLRLWSTSHSRIIRSSTDNSRDDVSAVRAAMSWKAVALAYEMRTVSE